PVVRHLVRCRLRADLRPAHLHGQAHPALGARWADGTPRRHRRRRQGCRTPDPLGRAAALQRHPHLRYLRRPRRQALAAHRRRLSEARHHLGTHRIRPHRAHRHADRVAADHGGIACPATVEEALGAAGRHSAVGALQRPPLPPARLFLHRLRADARYLRQADQRLGFGRQAGLRHHLFDHRHRCLFAGHAGHGRRDQARQQGSGSVPPEAARLQQRGDRGLQVPFDVCGQGRPDRQAGGDEERSARHPRRPVHPQDLDRRTAAILQFAVRLAVADRAAPARHRRAVAQPPLQRGGRRLFRPAPGQARRHRLGADQRLARRDGHQREDPQAHRIRSLLHRKLVASVRPEDPVPDAGAPAQHGKRVLSVAAHELPPAAINAKLIAMISSGAIFIGIFLSGFVIHEPAPYDLYMAGLIAVWALFGLRISKPALPLLVLLVTMNIGGMVAMTQMADLASTPLYLAVSLFLAFTAVFFAAVTEARPDIYRLIFFAYVVSAVITSLLGIAGYFHAFPGAEIFTKYDRAAGAFQDPNVFGPFLVLPGIYLLYLLLTGPVSRMPLLAVPLLIITAGIFFSFSRGAWGMFAVSAILLTGTLFLQSNSGKFRLRVVVMSIAAVSLLVLAVLVILQLPGVSEMFSNRAHLEQSYDTARL